MLVYNTDERYGELPTREGLTDTYTRGELKPPLVKFFFEENSILPAKLYVMQNMVETTKFRDSQAPDRCYNIYITDGVDTFHLGYIESCKLKALLDNAAVRGIGRVLDTGVDIVEGEEIYAYCTRK